MSGPTKKTETQNVNTTTDGEIDDYEKYMQELYLEGHDPDLDENGICRVCGQYEPE